MPGKAPLPVLGWAGSAIEIAVNIIDDYLTMSFDNLMNKYN